MTFALALASNALQDKFDARFGVPVQVTGQHGQTSRSEY